MAVQMMRSDAEAWRLPGCDERCKLRTVIESEPLRRTYSPVHDPDAHEEWGMVLVAGEAAIVVRTGPLKVDLTRRTVTLAGRDVTVTRREWTVIELLAQKRGGVVTFHDLGRAFFGTQDIAAYCPNSFRMWINRLRGKLRGAAWLIETRVGLGYCLVMVPPCDELPATPQRRWARTWDFCVRCGTTERAHEGRGLCGPCRALMPAHGEVRR